MSPLPNPASKERLPIHEWMAVVAIISTFAALTIVSLLHYEGDIEETDAIASEPLLEITVQGAVKYPGVYQVEKGTLVLDLIDQAEPLPTADLKKIKTTSPITKRRKINVPEKGPKGRKGLQKS